MAFEAGKLDVKVTLLRGGTVHDGLQKVVGFVTLGNRFASRRPLSGGERGEGEARRSFGRYSVWLRKDSLTASLLATDAIAMNGQRFELVEPPREVEMARRRGIELLVESTGETWSAP